MCLQEWVKKPYLSLLLLVSRQLAQRRARRSIRASKNTPVYKEIMSTLKQSFGECRIRLLAPYMNGRTYLCRPVSLIQPGKHQQKGWLSLQAQEAALLWLGRACSSLTRSLDLQRAAGKYYCGWFLSLYFLRESSDTSSSYSQIRWPESLFNSHCIAGETIKKCIE